MPANSYLGQRAIVRSVVDETSFSFSRADTLADCRSVPSAGTSLLLPDNPSNGDSYAWSNTDGSCGSGAPIVLVPQGSAKIQGGESSEVFATAFSSGHVVFVDQANEWAVFDTTVPPASGVVAEPATFVWNDGGTTSGNVYGSWEALYAVLTPLAAIGSAYTVTMPVSGTIPDGTYRLGAGGTIEATGDGASGVNINGNNIHLQFSSLTLKGITSTPTPSDGEAIFQNDGTQTFASLWLYDCTLQQMSNTQLLFGEFVYVWAFATAINGQNGTNLNGVIANLASTESGVVSLQISLFSGSTISGAFTQSAGTLATGFVRWDVTSVPNPTRPNHFVLSANWLSTIVGAAPGTAPYNPNWYNATHIWIDPTGGLGSDTNSGTSAGEPLLTMAEVVRRYGSASPRLSTSGLIVTQLSTQTPGVDRFVFSPDIEGGNVNPFLWDGLTNATPVGGTFSATAITPKTQSATPTFLTLTIGVSPATGSLIKNVTKGSFATVVSTSSGCQVTQPLLLHNFPGDDEVTEDNTWATTDVLQNLTPLVLNWDNIEISTQASALIQGVTLQNAGFIRPKGPCIFWQCSGGALNYDGTSAHRRELESTPLPAGEGLGLKLFGFYSADFGGYFTHCNLSGGYFVGDASVQWEFESCALDCDVFIEADTIEQGGYTITGITYVGSACLHQQTARMVGGTVTIAAMADAAILYGSATLNVTGGCVLQNASGGTFANCLKMATLNLDGVATGSSFNASASGNPFTAGVSLTSADMDTGGGAGNPGLQNPRTGSRYAST